VTFPAPRPGLVIRYSFLWSHEREEGADEGAKDRPSAIVVAAPRRENGDVVVIVAPITHAPPADPLDSIEIPRAICRSLGLDERSHWLRLDELNRFAWPGYDLRSIPGRETTPMACFHAHCSSDFAKAFWTARKQRRHAFRTGTEGAAPNKKGRPGLERPFRCSTI
jgi:hypothetical protein